MTNDMTGQLTRIVVSPFGDEEATESVVLVEKIGFGYLGKCADGRYASAHYDFSGRLRGTFFPTEEEAREAAEASKWMMS